MIDRIEELKKAALAAVAAAPDAAALEQVRVEYLGRKGSITEVLSNLGQVPAEERPGIGQAGNRAKAEIAAALEERTAVIDVHRLDALAETEAIDVTFPAPALGRGHAHVLSQVRRQLEVIFERIGYTVEEGPEIETDWYNFEALNLPKGHASRDVQDTFFLDAAGRVYRRENLDATHLACFMQLEGLAVDEGLTVGDLKGTLLYMVQSLFGPQRQVRMRPHHFGYTEPSFEFDTLCGRCLGKGCRSCGQQGWLETGGCGMVHPQVLRNGGVDPERYSGYAWGFGIERMAMLEYDVEDLRLLYENDLRFNRQF